MTWHAVCVCVCCVAHMGWQTCDLAIPPAARGGSVEVIEEIRETHGQHPCNKRRAVAQLRAEFPAFDFASLQHEDDTYYSDVRESPAEVRDRRCERCA